MKRIAIITPCFFGATFPLAKRWLEEGFHVDYYFSAGKTADINEGVDFIPCKTESVFGMVKHEACPGLFTYMNSDRFRLKYFVRPRPFKNVPIIRNIWKFYLNSFDKRFAKYINSQQYDYVNLVGQCSTDYYETLLSYIKSPIVVSLHEVIPNLVNKDNVLMPKWFKSLFASKCNIVVHSQNSYDDLKRYSGVDFSRVHLIHFGLFESFRNIKPDFSILQGVSSPYILFFGVIRPYKGLDLLYKAVRNHRDYFSKYKLVVAGSGYDENIVKIKNDDSFICINRRISNAELVSLISNAMFIVCPYRGVSQSGVPQTTFVFNKPIVATNLSAFSEMMTDGHNCLLFEPENSDDLALKMKHMIDNTVFFEKNVAHFEIDNPSFDWKEISNQYQSIFNIL